MNGINCDQIREDVKERVKKNREIILDENTDDKVVGALKRNNSLLMKLRNTLLEDGGLNAYDIKSDGKNPETAKWKARCERFRKVLNEWSPMYLRDLFDDGLITYGDFAYLEDKEVEVEGKHDFLVKKLNIAEKPVKTCIIYSPSYCRARGKLDEIISEKRREGIFADTVSRKNEVRFEDGERWKIVCMSGHLHGLRWDKCLADEFGISVGTLNHDILPHAAEGCRDNIEWF